MSTRFISLTFLLLMRNDIAFQHKYVVPGDNGNLRQVLQNVFLFAHANLKGFVRYQISALSDN